MDSFEGDLGIPSFSKPPRTISTPQRSQTLPAASSPLPPSSHHQRPIPTRSSSTQETVTQVEKDLTRRLSFPDATLQQETIDKLNRWILGFLLVDFDIDTGPNLDNSYPHLNLPRSVRTQLAFSSLPEGDLSPQQTQEGYHYSWRIPYPNEEELDREDRKGKGKQRVLRLPKVEGEEQDGGLYGYVWFNQERNTSLRRNYSQRSLVLLTHHPHLPGLFSAVLEVLGPLHFLHAKTQGAKGGMVESACLNIAAWPNPVPGSTLELPLLGTVLTVSLPLPYQAQYPTSPSTIPSSLYDSTTIPSIPISATHPTIPLCILLFSSPTTPSPSSSSSQTTTTTNIPNVVGFTKLLLLWELLVIGEPVLVFSNDPRTVGQVVTHLKNLIRPIPFVSEFKPYFHVHDPSFPILCRPGSTKPPSGLLIGSTNPLMLSNCKHWPHVLRLDRINHPPSSISSQQNSPLSIPSFQPPPPPRQSTTTTTTNHLSSSSPLKLQTQRSPSIVSTVSTSSTSNSTNTSRSSSLVRPSQPQHDHIKQNGSSTSLTSTNSPLSTSSVNGFAINDGKLPGSNGVKALGGGGGGGGGGGSLEKGEWWGLKSERKRHVKKDESVAKEIEKRWLARDYVGCDEIIYRHFASLTEKLLSPISRFLVTSIGSTIPSSSSTSTTTTSPPCPLLTTFLPTLKSHGTPFHLRPSSSSAFSVSLFTSNATSPRGSSGVERFYQRVWKSENGRVWRESRWNELCEAKKTMAMNQGGGGSVS